MDIDSTYITRLEHQEYAKRIEADHRRIDARLKKLEDMTEQMNSLVVSVEKLAISVERLATEQKEQNDKIDAIESRDGDMWRKVVSYGITAIVGILVGFIFKKIGF